MSQDLDWWSFFLNKSLLAPWGPTCVIWSWLRWPSPNVPACLNLKFLGHPLVTKFSNRCHFLHFLRAKLYYIAYRDRHYLKVWFRREKFNIVFFAETFWGSFYICIEIRKNGAKNSMLIFHGRPIFGEFWSPVNFLKKGLNSPKKLFKMENIQNLFWKIYFHK